jgi:transcriptional regulator with XRE-family HTH domain
MKAREDLSALVRRVMAEKQLTARKVEQASGNKISDGYINKMLTGEVTNLSVEKIVALAKGLSVDPHEVFTACYGHLPPGKPADPFAVLALVQKLFTSEALLELLQEAVGLSEEDQNILVRHANTLNEANKIRKDRKSG